MANVKTPPHNSEAEDSVLGAILIDKDAIGLVSEVISPKDFFNDINGIIYDAMLSLYEERRPIDLITLKKELKKIKNGDKVDTSYLSIWLIQFRLQQTLRIMPKLSKTNRPKGV